MFICQSCEKQQMDHVTLRRVVTKIRKVTYVDQEGNHVADGNEIIKEIAVCDRCAARAGAPEVVKEPGRVIQPSMWKKKYERHDRRD